MRPQEAVLILQKLRTLATTIIPIQADSGFNGKIVRILNDGKSGKPLMKYVNRLEYMEWLQRQFNLVPKRGDLRNAISRNLRGI